MSAIATLPTGWRIDKQTLPGIVGTLTADLPKIQMLGGARFLNSSPDGISNFGAGVNNSEAPNFSGTNPDRAPGWPAAGDTLDNGETKSGNLYVALRAPANKDISSLSIGYDVEKYSTGINPSGFRVQLYSSMDGLVWKSAGNDFVSAFAKDEVNIGFDPAPGATIHVPATNLHPSDDSSRE